MDTAGAVVGISLAALTVWLLGSDGLSRGDFQRLVLIASVPALLGVLLLTRVRERPTVRAEAGTRAAWLALPETTAERRYLIAVLLFGLGNSSDAFVILRMIDVGVGVVSALLLLALMNVSHVLVARPAGRLSDRAGRRSLLLGAYAAYALIYAAFAGLNDAWQLIPLLILYGGYYGVTEGIARAFVTDLVPRQSRGSAFGWFYAATAIAALPASIVAGWLWTEFGPGVAFALGSVCAVAAAGVLATVPVPVREER
jgi:MFS family permease